MDYDESIDTIEQIERDGDYELFFLRKEDNHQFYSDDLINKIKLHANLKYTPNLEVDDPFLKVKFFDDISCRELSKKIKNSIKIELTEIMQNGDNTDLPKDLYRSVMGVMLSSNDNNAINISSGKSSKNYFQDFQVLFRNLLHEESYINAVDNLESDKNMVRTLNMIHDICGIIYFENDISRELESFLCEIYDGRLSKSRDWDFLIEFYDRLAHICNTCPSGPLSRVLDCLHHDERYFDPYMQGNIPKVCFTFPVEDRIVKAVNIASPTQQYTLEKASLIPEFKGALTWAVKERKSLLLVNLEGFSINKSIARGKVIEDLKKKAEFTDVLSTITLSKNCDFYHQSGEYLNSSMNHFKDGFIQEFMNDIDISMHGKRFIKEENLSFIKKIVNKINKICFGSKRTLSHQERLNFVEIFHQILILRSIYLSKADYVAIFSKDANDDSSLGINALYGIFTKKINPRFSIFLTFGSTFTSRERAINKEKLYRSVMAMNILSSDDGQKLMHDIFPSLKRVII